jgi:hypothetical protein
MTLMTSATRLSCTIGNTFSSQSLPLLRGPGSHGAKDTDATAMRERCHESV